MGTILAGVLGVVALVVYLLFRQLRRLSWQLTQLRVEHDCEKILYAMGVPTGTGSARPEPVRRKQHLALHKGGGAAAVLIGIGQQIREHSAAAATSAGMFAATAATTAMIVLQPGTPDSAERILPSPSSEPTISSTASARAPNPDGAPGASPTTSHSPRGPGPAKGGDPTAIDVSFTLPELLAIPETHVSLPPINLEPIPPKLPTGLPLPTAGPTSSPGAPSPSPSLSGPCLEAGLEQLADLDACL